MDPRVGGREEDAALVGHLEAAQDLLGREWDRLAFAGDEDAFDECGRHLRDLHAALEYARGLAAEAG